MSRRCEQCDRRMTSKNHDKCHYCRAGRAPEDITDEDITYPGSWYRKGLILAPTHERCPE